MPSVTDDSTAVNKHWDSVHKVHAARVLPGQYYVTGDHGEMITTVLGSCIAACIRDPDLSFGGMNHFMLPAGDNDSFGTRYGVHAMEHLINDIIKHGGNRARLEIKIFGGGRMLQGVSDIGQKNIDFITEFLATEGFTVAAQDLGDEFSRKVNYFPSNGRVMVKRLRSLHTQRIQQEERAYANAIEDKPQETDIELFT